MFLSVCLASSLCYWEGGLLRNSATRVVGFRLGAKAKVEGQKEKLGRDGCGVCSLHRSGREGVLVNVSLFKRNALAWWEREDRSGWNKARVRQRIFPIVCCFSQES